jgi:NAD+ synthetase
LKIALAQIDTTVGALEANADRVLDAWRRAAALGAELVVYPEMTLTGYPPKDLLELPDFVRRNVATLESVAAQMTGGPGAVVGYVQPRGADEGPGKPLYNAAALIDGGRVLSRHFKTLLPTYDVFDEQRHFEPAPRVEAGLFRGQRLAITICEDFWNNDIYAPAPFYHRDPVDELAGQGVDLLINIAASPYSVGKRAVKARMHEAVARRWKLPLVHVNSVGGNDGLIFDGWSNAWDAAGRLAIQAAEFREDLVLWDSDLPATDADAPPAWDAADGPGRLWGALTLGIRDYMAKCGFKKAVVGSSGGIDSALTLALAAAAIGRRNVVSVAMPSQFSSGHSRSDAADLAGRLGVEHHEIAIEPIYQAYLARLDPLFAGTPFGLAEENLQSRARGCLLMTLSNKFGWLVLATGNKSELAVGYCTLYGDMCGGLAVLGDLLKTDVYAVARWRNDQAAAAGEPQPEPIPRAIVEKAPSAELRPDQFDTDSLPPYDKLDPIIAAYVEDRLGPEAIVARGHDPATVARVLKMIDRAEYKRQQAAVCLKVKGTAFGVGRRMPIARGE